MEASGVVGEEGGGEGVGTLPPCGPTAATGTGKPAPLPPLTPDLPLFPPPSLCMPQTGVGAVE